MNQMKTTLLAIGGGLYGNPMLLDAARLAVQIEKDLTELKSLGSFVGEEQMQRAIAWCDAQRHSYGVASKLFLNGHSINEHGEWSPLGPRPSAGALNAMLAGIATCCGFPAIVRRPRPPSRRPVSAERRDLAAAITKRIRKQLGRRVDAAEAERLLEAGRTEAQIREELGR